MNYAVFVGADGGFHVTPVDWAQAESLKGRGVPVFPTRRQAYAVRELAYWVEGRVGFRKGERTGHGR